METTIDPVYQLFQGVKINRSTESREWLPYYDVTPQPPAGTTTWNILVRDTEQWQNISEAMLEVQAHIAKNDNSNLDGTNLIAPVVNGWNIFSKAVLRLQGKDVEHINYCGTVSTITGLAGLRKDYVNSQGTEQMLFFDTGTGAVIAPADAAVPVGVGKILNASFVVGAGPGNDN